MGMIKGKIVIIFILLILIVSLGLGGYTYSLLQKEQARSLSLSEQLDLERVKHKATISELEEVQGKVNGLEANLSESKLRISGLMEDLGKEKTMRLEALAEISQLKSSIDESNSLKSSLEKKLADSEQVAKALEARLKEMEGQIKKAQSNKSALENKFSGSDAGAANVELGKIVVNPENKPVSSQAQGSSVSKLEGKVLVVNKDYNFAVINLGGKDGVSIGNIFSVYHDNKNIGDVRVEKIHDSMSAAGFLSAETKDRIVEGDRVELKN